MYNPFWIVNPKYTADWFIVPYLENDEETSALIIIFITVNIGQSPSSWSAAKQM